MVATAQLSRVLIPGPQERTKAIIVMISFRGRSIIYVCSMQPVRHHLVLLGYA